ncbi:MAG: LAGLIDADG family homing endonuclease, partial [Candidatus Pacearchaeota archaeon]|nr:LAGLIDADG family homing endonuclease [Candidatus Pacearchaeota archaeon]
MIAKYNFELNEDMIYLIETLKVEGYWSKSCFTLTLQNKDIPLINHVEEILKELNIEPGKRILLKIKLKDNTKKEKVDLIWDEKKLNFHIEKSPFDNKKVKVVTSLPYKNLYELNLINANKKLPIKITCFKNKVDIESELVCWAYKDLRFPTKKLLDFLEEYCGNKKNFHVEKFLFNADKELVMSAFSALIDCEGTINWYGLKRVIQIRMRNKKYLEQWSKLLKKWGIGNKLRKNKNEWEINISGWEDFDKLNKMGFKLYHSKKSEKWEKMMKGFNRNQISRGSYREFYINKLKEINKKITSEEFSKCINKSKRVANHYL